MQAGDRRNLRDVPDRTAVRRCERAAPGRATSTVAPGHPANRGPGREVTEVDLDPTTAVPGPVPAVTTLEADHDREVTPAKDATTDEADSGVASTIAVPTTSPGSKIQGSEVVGAVTITGITGKLRLFD